MNDQEIFKTKTGFCHILPNEIILTRDGAIGNLSKIVVGNNIARILLIYGVISLVFLYIGFKSFQDGDMFLLILCLLFSVYLIYGIINSINNSSAPIIHRNAIINIKFKKGISGLTRSRFEVFFKNENNKVKKRLIILDNDESEIEKAMKIMQNHKLI